MAVTVLLMIGTAKGLFLARRERVGDAWQVSVPHFPMTSVYAVGIDTRGATPRLLAGVESSHFGPSVAVSDDLGTAEYLAATLGDALPASLMPMVLFIVAAGLSLVFGALRIVNVAHGSFYMLGAFVAEAVEIAKRVGADLAMTASWNNGLELTTKDKAFRFHVGGRWQFDTSWFSADSSVQANLLAPIPMFFALGLFATLVRSDLKVPEPLYVGLVLYLLAAIGLKGGAEIHEVGFSTIWMPLLAAALLGALIPCVGYVILRRAGGFSVQDAAAIAGHYGSVSAVTFAVALSGNMSWMKAARYWLAQLLGAGFTRRLVHLRVQDGWLHPVASYAAAVAGDAEPVSIPTGQ